MVGKAAFLTPADQLALFVEAASNGTGRPAKGPAGLLMALVQRGLDEDPPMPAAALVLELDAEAAREHECAAR